MNDAAAPKRRGFRRLSFEEAWPKAVDHFIALEAAEVATTPEECERFNATAKSLGNRISPAAKQAVSPMIADIRREVSEWKRTHPGPLNVSQFIAHFSSLPQSVRHYRAGGTSPLKPDALRKILRRLGYIGRPGRPPGT